MQVFRQSAYQFADEDFIELGLLGRIGGGAWGQLEKMGVDPDGCEQSS